MRVIFWWLRRQLKDLWCYSGYGSMLVEYCEDCGIQQPLVWWSDNDLWEELTGYETPAGDNATGIICPRCFDARAERAGILLRWYPAIEHRTVLKPDTEKP